MKINIESIKKGKDTVIQTIDKFKGDLLLPLFLRFFTLLVAVASFILMINQEHVKSENIWTFFFSSEHEKNNIIQSSQHELSDELKTAETNTMYFFIVDISGSFYNKSSRVELDEKKLKRLRQYITTKRSKDFPYLSPDSIKNIQKYFIYQILHNNILPQSNKSKDKFAILGIGTDLSLIYKPPGNISQDNIEESLKVWNDFESTITPEMSKFTDFNALFQDLPGFFDQMFQDDQSKPNKIVITILSDFLHDPKSPKIDEANRLRKKIQEFSGYSVFVNLITVPVIKKSEKEKSVIDVVKKEFGWYRTQVDSIKNLESISCGNINYDAFPLPPSIYPSLFTKKPLEIYYTDKNDINSNFFINTSGEVTVQVPNFYSSSEMFPDLLFGVCKTNDNSEPIDSTKIKYLKPGKIRLDYHLGKNEGLLFSFKGRLPYNPKQYILQLSDKDKNIVYKIPIVFTKILPLWASWLIDIIFWTLLVAALPMLIYRILRVFFKKTDNLPGTSDESIEKIEKELVENREKVTELQTLNSSISTQLENLEGAISEKFMHTEEIQQELETLRNLIGQINESKKNGKEIEGVIDNLTNLSTMINKQTATINGSLKSLLDSNSSSDYDGLVEKINSLPETLDNYIESSVQKSFDNLQLKDIVEQAIQSYMDSDNGNKN